MIEQSVLTCEALGPCAVIAVRGHEAMGELPRWQVDVLSGEGTVELASLLGEQTALALGDDDGSVRRVPLQIDRASYQGKSRDGHRYRLELVSRAFFLTLRAGYRIFQQQTAQQIIAQVLADAGIPSSEIAWRLAGRHGERVYCVQYDETEWQFVERLCADDGINVWHDETDDGAPLMVFGDDDSSHGSVQGSRAIRYEDPSGQRQSGTSLSSLELCHEMACDAVYLREYDVRQPDRLIEGAAGTGSLEHYEFPANVLNEEMAQQRAAQRLEQLQRLSVRAEARSGNVRLQPGRVITIEGCADEGLNGDFLIVSADHELHQATPNAPTSAGYHNRLMLVPFGQGRVFRPALPRREPRVDGTETAVVTGPVGEEIHVDDLGCIKARFRWDRSGVEDDTSSRWLRTLQLNLFGSMLLPRIGWEVPIVYVDGDPDRPFALGRLYNSSSPGPYGQPGRQATSTLQSATSPSDGTTQEIRFADDAGGMEAFVHATKDQSITVGGDHTVVVAGNRTDDVKKSSALTVKGAQSTSVGGNQDVVVGANAGIAVGGGRSESIGGMESIGVTGSLFVECGGGYTETVGAVYGIQCNQHNEVIQGSFTQSVGGPMVLAAGLGTNQSCAAARLENVGGVRSITAGASCADSTMGVKSITAGASKDKAGGAIVTSVGAVGSITVGSTASLSAGGRLAIQAPTITIKAGSFTAKGGATLKVAGNIKASGGKTKFKAGKTKRTSKSKVGG